MSSTESESKSEGKSKTGSIDYTKGAAKVAEEKAKAHDADSERLAKEHAASA